MIKLIYLLIICIWSIECLAQENIPESKTLTYNKIIKQFLEKNKKSFENIEYDSTEIVTLNKEDYEFTFVSYDIKNTDLSGNIEMIEDKQSIKNENRRIGNIWICFPTEYYVMTKRYITYNWYLYNYTCFVTQNDDSINAILKDTVKEWIYVFNYRELQDVECSPFPPKDEITDKERRKILLEETDKWFHVPYITSNIIKKTLFNYIFKYYLVHWPPVIKDQYIVNLLHQKFQSKETAAELKNLLANQRPDNIKKIYERVKKPWVSSTLRGYVKYSGSSPEGDFPTDHPNRFYNPDPNRKRSKRYSSYIPYIIENPRSMYSFYDEKYERACDWCLHLVPDSDVNYLKSCANSDYVEVEIERFALEKRFRPKAGDYCQVIGRWVIDAGHEVQLVNEKGDSITEYRSEIHPPELIASTSYSADGLSGITRVATTGAWKGQDLKFFIFPPKRPGFSGKLSCKSTVNTNLHTDLNISKLPTENPNHLECTIKKKDNNIIDDSKISEIGMVLYHDNFSYKGEITTEWSFEIAENNNVIKEKTDTAAKYLIYGGIDISNYTGDFDSSYIYIVRSPTQILKTNPIQVNQNGIFSFMVKKGESYILYPSSTNLAFDSLYYSINSNDFIKDETIKNNTLMTINAKVKNETLIKQSNDLEEPTNLNELFTGMNKDEKLEYLGKLNSDMIKTMGQFDIDSKTYKANIYFYFHLDKIINENNKDLYFLDAINLENDKVDHKNNYSKIIKYLIHRSNKNENPDKTTNSPKNVDIREQYRKDRFKQINNRFNPENNLAILKGYFGRNSKHAKVRITILYSPDNNSYSLLNSIEHWTDKKGNIKLFVKKNRTSGHIKYKFPGYIKLKYEVIENESNPWYLPIYYSDPLFIPMLEDIDFFTLVNEELNRDSLKQKTNRIYGYEELSKEEKFDLEFLDAVKDFQKSRDIRTKYYARKSIEE